MLRASEPFQFATTSYLTRIGCVELAILAATAVLALLNWLWVRRRNALIYSA